MLQSSVLRRQKIQKIHFPPTRVTRRYLHARLWQWRRGVPAFSAVQSIHQNHTRHVFCPPSPQLLPLPYNNTRIPSPLLTPRHLPISPHNLYGLTPCPLSPRPQSSITLSVSCQSITLHAPYNPAHFNAFSCGSSPGNKPLFVKAAESVGKALAKANMPLVYGGGRRGIMGMSSRYQYFTSH